MQPYFDVHLARPSKVSLCGGCQQGWLLCNPHASLEPVCTLSRMRCYSFEVDELRYISLYAAARVADCVPAVVWERSHLSGGSRMRIVVINRGLSAMSQF
jgi:hypothetical protein